MTEAGRKMRVGVVFGGRSGEHEVSVKSARSVMERLDPAAYEVFPLAVTREGHWLGADQSRSVVPHPQVVNSSNEGGVVVRLGRGIEAFGCLSGTLPALDIIFPVMHGTYGEDGTIQGLLEMANLPYVGAGVAGSAIGMDKVLMKDVWASHGLPQPAWTVAFRSQIEKNLRDVVARVLDHPGLPCFIKPANLGSSVGITKARTLGELEDGLRLAAQFDRKVLIEASVEKPRELNLAVLGNEDPEVSVAGEIVHDRDWLDYAGKYIVKEGVECIIPATLEPSVLAEAQRLSIAAFQALDMNGLSRVDFLMDAQGRLLLNEINTMPGFTPVSIYAKLWAASGLEYSALLDRLIQLGLERFHDRQRNQVCSMA